MSMETTFGFVKPDAIAHWESIATMIREHGLTIGDTAKSVWKTRSGTEEIIRTLYPQDERIVAMTVERFLHQPCIAFQVKGDDAVRRFYRLAGTHVSPLRCDRDTIRHRYGSHKADEEDGTFYWPNAIHRARNKEEAIRQIHMFFSNA